MRSRPGPVRIILAVLGVAGGLALPGCGGASFEGGVYRGDGLAFRVGALPSGWRPIEASGALLAFRDDLAAATVAIGGRCGKDGDDVPLESLTHHLFLDFTDRSIESEERLALDGREALRTRLMARLDGVPKRFDVFVLKKNGCVYDFMFVTPPRASADAEERFAGFVAAFRTIAP